MVSKSKLYSKLDALEVEFENLLVPHLINAANGKNDLVFCVTAFNPFRELKNKTDRLSEELVEMGSQILTLREKLGEPTTGTAAERICWYCREWGTSQNKQKPNTVVNLAKNFLQEIEAK